MSYDKLIFEISKKGRIGHDLNIRSNNFKNISKNLLRETSLNLPEVTEPDVVRHYTNLSMKNFGVDTGFYPLGSCTMKYNPKINEVAAIYAFIYGNASTYSKLCFTRFTRNNV